MILDVGDVRRVEQKLRGAPLFAFRNRVGEVGVSGEAAGGVSGGEFHAIDLAIDSN